MLYKATPCQPTEKRQQEKIVLLRATHRQAVRVHLRSWLRLPEGRQCSALPIHRPPALVTTNAAFCESRSKAVSMSCIQCPSRSRACMSSLSGCGGGGYGGSCTFASDEKARSAISPKPAPGSGKTPWSAPPCAAAAAQQSHALGPGPWQAP